MAVPRTRLNPALLQADLGVVSGAPDQHQSEGLGALARAVERNAPLSVVRCEHAGRAPFANGRLISMSDEHLEIEDLRIIGRDAHFARGNDLDAYFTVEGATYAFRTRVVDARVPVRLNQMMVVKGMTLARPRTVELGQRRNAFRVSLAAADTRVNAELWRLRDTAEEDDMAGAPKAQPSPTAQELNEAMSARQPNLTGWVADASDRGLGVLISGHGAAKLSVFEVIALRLMVPGAPEPVVFPAEVRQVREVRPKTYKVGFTIAVWEMPREMQTSLRRLSDYLARVQREELKRRQAG